MSKKAKIELTPEELAEKKIRKSNGWTRFWAIVIAFALTAGVFSYARSQGAEASKADETTTAASSSSSSASSASSSDSWDNGNDSSSSNSSSSSSSSSSGSDSAASSTNDAETVATAINTATAKVANEKAGYTWKRNCAYTKAVDVSGATSILNKIISAIDSNSDLDSVVGSFIGVGDKDPVTVPKGADPVETIGYHGENYAIKASTLKASDLKNLSVNGNTYSFTLEDAASPQKDGSTSLSRLTNDFLTKDEVAKEIANFTTAVSVTSVDVKYTNIKVTAVVEDSKLTSLTFSYDFDATLVLKAGISITGTGAAHSEAKYTNFVY